MTHAPTDLHRRQALRGLLALAAAAACSPYDQAPQRPHADGGDGPGPAHGSDPLPSADAAALEVPTVSDDEATAIAQHIEDFAVDLHRKLATGGDNLIVSPASIALAFAMVHAGAKGATADELARVFHLQGDAERLSTGFAAALGRWREPQDDVQLHIANRLFGDRATPFERAFLDLTARRFGAPLEPVDFRGDAEGARKHINAWVLEQTRDRIAELIPARGLDASSRLVLVNAIYFKAGWSDPFFAHLTKDGDFFAAAGTRTAKMMHRTGHMPVVARDGATLVSLPYGHGRYAMTIALPEARNGLAALEAKLSRRWIDDAHRAMTHERVALALPRFRIEPGAPLLLRAVLESMGLHRVWDPGRADFTAMAPAAEQLVISEAFHKAFIALDEQGTEAAAATAVAMRAGGAPPSGEPLAVTVDHPFAFMLRDTETGAILFMGRVGDPTV